MKNILYLLALLFMVVSCKSTDKKLKERVSGSDSVVVNFFKGDGSMDTVVSVKVIRDRKKIEQLTDLIAADKSAKKMKCGYDGSMHYFKQNIVIQSIDFRLNDSGCMQFSYSLGGTVTATKLTSDAKKFIENLKSN